MLVFVGIIKVGYGSVSSLASLPKDVAKVLVFSGCGFFGEGSISQNALYVNKKAESTKKNVTDNVPAGLIDRAI